MGELLVELFSEEIPAHLQPGAAKALAVAVQEGLATRGMPVAADACRRFATPRRVALQVGGIAAAEPRRTVRRRGPRIDAPEQAQAGFRRSLEGVHHELEQEEDSKGRFWVAVVEEGGAPASTVIKDLLDSFLPRFPWPKSMRWGAGDSRWVRPLHRILCLLDGAVVPVRFAGIEAGATTEGHRFMAPGPLVVDSVGGYGERLRTAKVVVDSADRRDLIAVGAVRLAATAGLFVRDDPTLIDELVGLTEWPVPLLGRIDGDLMTLPREVLITSMRAHQKYLTLVDADGRLAPSFIVVANLEAPDGGAAIVAGNERVLRARLWDARFFWEQDRKSPLESRAEALDRMVFHARLGSMAAKSKRLERLAGVLAQRLAVPDPERAGRAGHLAKADLVTGMVGEFPELQGVMGAYYAEAQGEDDVVCQAIRTHYAPQGPADTCPTAPIAVAVALADKVDSLVGLMAAGERATGSGDPLGLRRLALGIIRLILENDLRLRLEDALVTAFEGYDGALDLPPRDELTPHLMTFITERLKVHLRGEGRSGDLIAAVLGVGAEDDLWRIREKVRALDTFLGSSDGDDLLAAYKRARNIVRIETRKDGVSAEGQVRAALLEAPAERDLYAQLEMVGPRMATALADERFADAMADLASLRAPVDRFFEEVLVNAEEAELRANRLRLLARLSGLLDAIAVFDVIEEPRAAA